MTDRNIVTENLLNNAKSAIIAAIEIHNKPIFNYRYEVCCILTINAWELLLKAYISKYRPDVNLFDKEGKTKPFTECLACVSGDVGKLFDLTQASIDKLYEYRNSITHFFAESSEIYPLVYSLLSKNIILFNNFIIEFFDENLLSEINMLLTPISFNQPFSPIDFMKHKLSEESEFHKMKEFINSIIDTSKKLQENGIDDSIIAPYNIHLINENRCKNADIIAAITKNINPESTVSIQNLLSDYTPSDSPDAKKIFLAEEEIRKYYPHDYYKIAKIAKLLFLDFIRNKKFNNILRELKGKNQYHHIRYLDISNPKTSTKELYSWAVLKEFGNHYTLREGFDLDKLPEDERLRI
ncbi:DUF3644 domain-containing protein [Herpetosiphon llansteffanensis]